MDKQNFQEQDFMEILVRLPCGQREKYFYPRIEMFLTANRSHSTREQKLFYLRAETFLPASRKYYLYSKEDRSY